MTNNQEVNPSFRLAVLALPITVLLIVPSMIDPINIPKLLALFPLSITSLVLFLTLRKKIPRKLETREIKLYFLLYSLLAISMLISGIMGSQNYIRILFGTSGRNNGLIYYFSSLAIALIVLHSSKGVREINYVNRIIGWTSLPFATYCAIQYLNLDPIAWNNPYSRVIGTLGNPNFSASALAIFAVFWLYKFTQTDTKSRALKFTMLGLSLVMSFLSWSTESLQGLVVIGLGFAFVTFIKLRQKNPNKAISNLFFGATSFGLIFSFTSFLGYGPLGSFLEQYTLKLRGWYALIGLRAMIDSPWTGVGIDSYVNAFRSSRGDEFVSQYGALVTSNNAHSTPAQIGASFGVVVFLLYCLIHLLVLYKALQIINSRSQDLQNSKGIAIIWILIFAQSLLSLEIIGLGVMNWILGAFILDTKVSHSNQNLVVTDKPKKIAMTSIYPVWVGSLTIITLFIGTIPSYVIYREDQTLKLLSTIQVTDQTSVDLVRKKFSKLSDYSLLIPENVDKVGSSLYRSNMLLEVEQMVTRLYSVTSDDAYAGDLLATFYLNTGQINKEIEVREKLRTQDPWNFKLELALAKAYAKAGNYDKLAGSVATINRLAPDSPEYEEAKTLIESATSANPNQDS